MLVGVSLHLLFSDYDPTLLRSDFMLSEERRAFCALMNVRINDTAGLGITPLMGILGGNAGI